MKDYKTVIQKFDNKGEKTGWTYIEIPIHVAAGIKKNNKKSFRVKGKIDGHRINGVSLLPMGKGDFILPLNAALRKALGKRHGAMVTVSLQEDKEIQKHDAELLKCLKDDKEAKKKFEAMPKSYQNYYSKWIASAKTENTKAKKNCSHHQCDAARTGFRTDASRYERTARHRIIIFSA